MYGQMARGMGSYNAGASAISSNAAAFRSDVDNIKGANKALVQQTYSANDLKHLYDIGAEGALRTLKPMVSKGLGYAYEKTGLKEWDNSATKSISNWRKKMGMEADDESGEINGRPTTSGEASESRSGRDGGTDNGEGEGEGGDVEMTDMGGEGTELSDMVSVGGRSGATTGVESEAADAYGEEGLSGVSNTSMEQIADQRGMRMEDVDAPEPAGQVKSPTDPQGVRNTDGVAPEDDGGSSPSDMGGETKEGDMAADDVGGDLAGDAAEEGGLQTAIGADEAAGAALDATGVGAIIGVPMQILGGLAELFGGYEAAKGVGEWFNEDVLGNHPKVPQMKLPSAPTIDNANLAIPSFDSVQDAPTSQSSW
jgi:hypothetical protein